MGFLKGIAIPFHSWGGRILEGFSRSVSCTPGQGTEEEEEEVSSPEK